MDSKYISIYHEILAKIEDGEIAAGSKLPSETEMISEYGASRDTIRKALHLLEQNGYIQRIQGKGSFALDINKLSFPVSGLTSFKELAQKMTEKCRTLVKELEKIPADEFIREQLKLPEQAEVWKAVRVRQIGGKKIILDKDFLDARYVPKLTQAICEDSIYEHLETKLGLKIGFAQKEVTVQQATQEDRKYLDFENYNMIVVVKNYTYLEDMTLFQYTESRHRPDKFKFVGFARRN